MKKINISLILGFVFTIIICDFLGFKNDYDDLQEDVLRMHILANSDSAADQQLKLKVRDELLEYSDELFYDCNGIDEACENAESKLCRIEEISSEVIKSEGYDYSVSAELVEMDFDDRIYDNITMPAGTYEAVRVTIGEAKGHNWWCVMYPPLCVPASSETDDLEYFSSGEYDIIHNPEKYEIKFKCLELLEEIMNK